MNPLETAMNERKYNVAEIINDAKINPLVSYDDSIKCFYVFAAEVDIYKYSGDNSRLFAKLDDEINTDTNGLKNFLETVIVSEINLRIIDIIKKTIV